MPSTPAPRSAMFLTLLLDLSLQVWPAYQASVHCSQNLLVRYRMLSASTPYMPPQWGRLNTGGRRVNPSSGV